jgi:Fibronectin type III domain
VTTALNALPTIGTVSVLREDLPAGSGFAWFVTFLDNTGAQPLLEALSTGLRGAGAQRVVTSVIVPGTAPPFDQGTVGINTLPLGSAELGPAAEVQSVWAVASAADLSGTFQVAFAGHTAPAEISAASGSAADMVAALESLPTVPTGVQASVEAVSGGRRWRVTFPAALGNTPALLVSTSTAAAPSAAGTVATAGSLKGTAAQVYTSVDVQGGLPTSFVTPQGLLTPGAQYYARVAAYTASGWGVPAAAAVAATTAVQPPSPPLDVTAATSSATTVDVAWAAPAETGGSPVTRYTVQWSTDSSFGTTAGEATVSTPAVSYTIKSLTPATTYFVRVAASNAAGFSEPSAAAASGASEAQIIVFTSTVASATCPASALVDGLYRITVTDPVTGSSSTTPAASPLRPDATAAQASNLNFGCCMHYLLYRMLPVDTARPCAHDDACCDC